MDLRVSPADGIPRSYLGRTIRGGGKVAYIGAWHPSRIQFTVPRAGLKDYNHGTEINKKIYRMGAGYAMKVNNNAATEYDSPTWLDFLTTKRSIRNSSS